jgi:hypothetical protein
MKRLGVDWNRNVLNAAIDPGRRHNKDMGMAIASNVLSFSSVYT